MPDWLADPSMAFYLVLAAFVLILRFLWFRKPERRALVRLGVAAGVLALVGVIDLVFESPREEAVRKTREMARASSESRLDDLFAHVSDAFDYGGVGKAALRSYAESAIRDGRWSGASVWDFDRSYYTQVDDDTIQIGFLVQPHGYNVIYYCIATFGKNPQGEYTLTTFELYNPLQRTNAPPIRVPGLR